MFKTAKDFKNYIKQTLKSSGVCSAPSRDASIWQIYNSKKFHPVDKSYCPMGDVNNSIEGTGIVIWKNGNSTFEQTNNSHKFTAFYLGYYDMILNGTPILYIHFEYDDNTIYNVGVECLKNGYNPINVVLGLTDVPDNQIQQQIFNLF